MDTTVLIITLIVIAIGIGGTFLPLIPGIPMIFVAIAAYGWYERFQVITPKYLVILAGITVLSMFIDYLTIYWGAKYFQSSKMGMYGAVLGGLAGIFIIPPLGLLVCPWLGAIAGELIQGNDFNKALRSGMGAVIGLFSGIAFKIIIGTGMLLSFLFVIF